MMIVGHSIKNMLYSRKLHERAAELMSEWVMSGAQDTGNAYNVSPLVELAEVAHGALMAKKVDRVRG